MSSPIGRLHVPLMRVEDVIPHLGRPSHFRDGYSAKLIAQSWFAANDLPIMVRTVLEQSTRLADAELVEAFLERQLALGDRWAPSQADVLAVLGLRDGLAIMAVEGKVCESFGRRVSEWIEGGSEKKHLRLDRISATLGIDRSAALPLRWQLLHRTASAIYEAKRYRARTAIMMVHSFDPRDAGVEDFKRFANALGLPEAAATKLAGPISCEGIDLYLGWAADRLSGEGCFIVDGRKTDIGFFDDLE